MEFGLFSIYFLETFIRWLFCNSVCTTYRLYIFCPQIAFFMLSIYYFCLPVIFRDHDGFYQSFYVFQIIMYYLYDIVCVTFQINRKIFKINTKKKCIQTCKQTFSENNNNNKNNRK